MEIALFIYLAGLAGKLSTLLFLLTFISSVLLIIHFAWCSDNRLKFNQKYLAIPLLTAFLCVATPSENTMYLMAAGYTTQKVANAVVESELAKDVLTVLELKVKEQIKDLQKSTK